MTKEQAREHLQKVNTGRKADLSTTRGLITAINGRMRVIREHDFFTTRDTRAILEEITELSKLYDQLIAELNEIEEAVVL
ncbi:MAG: hypothetical protein E7661_04555 [Ruminococcaceae bacterium]|nr:hypothetical protein [Oscillospiraceae bacterium]